MTEQLPTASPVVTYALENGTKVRFEVEPTDEWYPVSAETILGQVQQAVKPAVEGAKAVLDKIREISPDEVEVTFGIKVSGQANWIVAKTATDANFEVKLTWKRSGDKSADDSA